MTMKSIKYIFEKACVAGLLTLFTTSCQDWLTIYPQDRIVEEDFWEDKNDLEGVRYGAYRQMASTVSKLAVWGDLRSDSYQINRKETNSQGNRDMYVDIMNGQPDSSMSVFDWGGVYTTINLCNKVLQHGDEILAKDKQFQSSEWIQMRAEMTALRALNYFYLVRAFKDIPYTTRVINSDEEVIYNDTLTPQLQVLDSIIMDCERVKGQARNRFSSTSDSKGLITNAAIYAMLADMCLWRASLQEGRHDSKSGFTYDILYSDGVRGPHTWKDDYEMAALYADTCLQVLAKQTEDSQDGNYGMERLETENYGLTNCNMIKNDFTGAAQSMVPELEAMQAIFNTGNSDESIFELQFSKEGLSNSTVNSLYGFNDGTHLEVCKEALDAIYEGGISGEDTNLGGKWDSRAWVCCQNLIAEGDAKGAVSAQPAYYCLKYEMPQSGMLNMTTEQVGQTIQSVRYSSSSYHNWIVYRMTDVMLIKAEALVHSGATTSTNKKAVQAICNAIHRRSYCDYKNGTTVGTDPTSGFVGNAAKSTEGDMDKWVLNERQIELLGEGKRWFDLVRYAERNSYASGDALDELDSNVPNGYTGMKKMIDDYLSNAYQTYATTLRNRFKNRWGLYCPIYYMEVKATNYSIRQNPVWNKSKYEQ